MTFYSFKIKLWQNVWLLYNSGDTNPYTQIQQYTLYVRQHIYSTFAVSVLATIHFDWSVTKAVTPYLKYLTFRSSSHVVTGCNIDAWHTDNYCCKTAGNWSCHFNMATDENTFPAIQIRNSSTYTYTLWAEPYYHLFSRVG